MSSVDDSSQSSDLSATSSASSQQENDAANGDGKPLPNKFFSVLRLAGVNEANIKVIQREYIIPHSCVVHLLTAKACQTQDKSFESGTSLT